jgi:hypothetical protein
MQEREPWWNGSVRNGMNVEYQARQFYGDDDRPGLLDIPGWESRSITEAVASVQRPSEDLRGAYAQFEPIARSVVSGSAVTCEEPAGRPTAGGPWVA